MDTDKEIHITIPDDVMQLVNEQAEILHMNPMDVLETALKQSIMKKAKERGMKVRIESVNTNRLS